MTVGEVQAYGPPVVYLASVVLFILGLKLAGRARSIRRGLGLLAAAFAVAAIGVGVEVWGRRVGFALSALVAGAAVGLLIARASRSLPRSAAVWAALGGVAAALVAVAAFLNDQDWPLGSPFGLHDGPRGAALGLACLSGLAALVLGAVAAGGSAARASVEPAATALTAAASGLATAMLGLALGVPVAATVGALMATAGFSLATTVSGALGRKPLDAVLGTAGKGQAGDYGDVKACGSEEIAMVLETARKVIIVPGYGMAVAQAQQALAEVASLLARRGTRVLFAIHPVAGVIPGHMNILLDEAKIATSDLYGWEAANREMADADVALVVGANDTVNPAARDDATSPLFGMPVIDVGRAGTVFVLKRSLRPGAAGVKNRLFEEPNTNLVFGDAKKTLQAISVELKAITKAAAA